MVLFVIITVSSLNLYIEDQLILNGSPCVLLTTYQCSSTMVMSDRTTVKREMLAVIIFGGFENITI